jgi:hypothetical protein
LSTIIAIDPGASGAVAWRNGLRYDHIGAKPTVGLASQSELIYGLRDMTGHAVVYIEQVGGYIGKPQPGSAMFKFGMSYGRWLGILEALRIRTVLVRPQVWQKTIGLGSTLKGPDRKRALRDIAKRLYPTHNVTLANCDALLILEHAIQAEARREGGAT